MMLVGILALLFVTFLFGSLGICIAKEVKGQQKGWALLFVFVGWAAIVAYATNLSGLWGKTFDPSTPFPDWLGISLSVLILTFPFAFPLIVGIKEIWRGGGKNTGFALPFFDEKTGIGILYVVSLGLSFYLTDHFGIHYGWSFPISLPVLLVLFFVATGVAWAICWLTTQMAQRFSPASRRSRRIENK